VFRLSGIRLFGGLSHTTVWRLGPAPSGRGIWVRAFLATHPIAQRPPPPPPPPEKPPPPLPGGDADDAIWPVKPMLGGLAVAPDFGFGAPSTGDTGRWGGNMDFNRIAEGATVYLPVYQPGAMLYLGDGHALQGDGETTQWALETSLDVEFSVEVLPGRALAAPRVEDDTSISTIGQASSLDEAVRAATAAMIQWLEQDYGLDVSEASLVLGTVAEFRVVTLAGRNAAIALSLDKARLSGLTRDDRRTDSKPRSR